ncbi:MAG: polymer-forming cytoskeletal protein [Xanthomonadales bacterium]|nr:polymer-forming cytoskeletal protein [Xanthomonadales bacterium]
MAIWKDPTQPKKDTATFPQAEPSPAAAPINPTRNETASAAMSANADSLSPVRAVPASSPAMKESVIASDLTIEGKIQGAGHVRIAGRFKGDVDVKGDLTVEQGAKLDGSVKADKVVVSGELDGNIHSANRVELLATCAMNGDIKADTLTVASGSRLRGRVECGNWDNAPAKRESSDASASKHEASSTAA